MAACIAETRSMLRRPLRKDPEREPAETGEVRLPDWSPDSPPAVETVASLFGLSQFEKFLLILCAAAELDSETARLCSEAQGNPASSYPTFGLALATLPQPHWSALAPSSPLRKFRLIDVLGSSSTTLTTSPLMVEERVLHYLTGVASPEPAMSGMVRPVHGDASLTDTQQAISEKIVALWGAAEERVPLIQLWGADETGKISVSKTACSKMGLGLWHLNADSLPQKTDEIERFAQLWSREAALLGSGLFISAEEAEPEVARSIRRLLDSIPGPVFLGTREPWPSTQSRAVQVEVKKPTKTEQAELWELHLGRLGSPRPTLKGEELSRLVGQFDLSAQMIEAAVREAALLEGGVGPFDSLWDACRTVTRPRIGELAQQIDPRAEMEDLVLPEKERQLLAELALEASQRRKVYEDWGFGEKMSRGLGITALFAGSSGTGKTMAAEALANELRLDLFKIDLANVVSKYIGETEKNLRRVFDSAEDGGAILFFDEADALFGRRSEVRDSHDRYANIEVSYLLQRMESYRGLAILATNMKSALDPAFVRRIRFIVDFPFPDKASRTEIWRGVFPRGTPTQGLEVERLAKLSITGGNIRNIALYASFLAAGEGVPVSMKHLKRAVEVEYGKLERPLTQAELGDWR